MQVIVQGKAISLDATKVSAKGNKYAVCVIVCGTDVLKTMLSTEFVGKFSKLVESGETTNFICEYTTGKYEKIKEVIGAVE